MIAKITEPRAVGDLLPYILSDIQPRAILPAMAPKSIVVDRFAISYLL